jgi:hypothetical protein
MFIVTGKGPQGTVSHRHPGAKAAMEAALRLAGQGFSDVLVHGPDGKVYTLSELPSLLDERGKFER